MSRTRTYNGFSGEQRDRSTPWQKRQYEQGIRPRPARCLACDQTHGTITGHWEDYTEPFGPHNADLALCHRCHMMVHGRFTAAAVFGTYCQFLRGGYQFPILSRRDTAAMYAQIRSNQLPKPFKTREAQAVCWFDLYLWDKSWLKVEALALPLIKWLPRSAVVEGMRA